MFYSRFTELTIHHNEWRIKETLEIVFFFQIPNYYNNLIHS